MSNLNDIISQINSLSGYNLPTSSNNYYISASAPLGSGSVNQIINQINTLTGFNIPSTSVTYVSGSNIAGEQIVIYLPTATSGTISTEGIEPGAVIKSEQVLRIIDALNGISPNLIIMSGSLVVTGSVSFSSSLALPFINDGEVLIMSGGLVTGTSVPVSSSYAISSSYALSSSFSSTAISSSYALSSSFSSTAISSSYALSSSYSTIAEFAKNFNLDATASYALYAISSSQAENANTA